jgi:hypothetical protein
MIRDRKRRGGMNHLGHPIAGDQLHHAVSVVLIHNDFPFVLSVRCNRAEEVASHKALTICAKLSYSFRQDSYCFLNNFLNNDCGRFDLPHEAGTLASEKIHGVDVSGRIPRRRHSAKARQRHASAERNFSNDGFVRALF